MHKILTEALRDASISAAADRFSRRGEFLINGVAGAQKILIAAAAFELKPRPTIILVSEREKISAWRDDLAELSSAEVVELPELDLVDVAATAAGIERQARRLEILSRLLRGERLIVLATTAAAVKKDFSRRELLQLQMPTPSRLLFLEAGTIQKRQQRESKFLLPAGRLLLPYTHR